MTSYRQRSTCSEPWRPAAGSNRRFRRVGRVGCCAQSHADATRDVAVRRVLTIVLLIIMGCRPDAALAVETLTAETKAAETKATDPRSFDSLLAAAADPAQASAAEPEKPTRFDWRRIGLQSDNDEYTRLNAFDRWYSSGVRLDVLANEPVGLPDPVATALDCPTMMAATAKGHGRGYFSLGQDIYTQNDRTQTEPNPDDRPVAGLLYLQAGRSLRQATTRSDIRLEAGVTGPASFGEQSQDAIHAVLGVDQVPLWRNQVRPRLGLNLHLSCLRQYRFADAGLRSTTLNTQYGLSAGNLLSQVRFGVSVAFGPDAQRLHVPQVARHVNPVREPIRQWVFGAGVGVRAVFFDALVDGDAYGYTSRVESKRWQGDAFVSLSVAIGGNWQVSYTLTRRSLEFDGPGVAAQGFKPQTIGLIAIEAPLY